MQVCGPFKRLGKHFTHWNPWLCYAVCVVDQEPGGEKTAIEQLEYLKAVFSEEGADGVGEQLHAVVRDKFNSDNMSLRSIPGGATRCLGVDAGVAMTSTGQHRPPTVARASKPEKKVGFVRVSASTILIC